MNDFTGGPGGRDKIHLLAVIEAIAGCGSTSRVAGAAVSRECRLYWAYGATAGY